VQTKAIIYQNLWNFALLSAILFSVHIALEKLTQVLSYVFCTYLRRHVHKQITKRRYREEKTGRFVFENPVLFTLSLGLTMPYSFDLLVWNFYQTFVIVCIWKIINQSRLCGWTMSYEIDEFMCLYVVVWRHFPTGVVWQMQFSEFNSMYKSSRSIIKCLCVHVSEFLA